MRRLVAALPFQHGIFVNRRAKTANIPLQFQVKAAEQTNVVPGAKLHKKESGDELPHSARNPRDAVDGVNRPAERSADLQEVWFAAVLAGRIRHCGPVDRREAVTFARQNSVPFGVPLTSQGAFFWTRASPATQLNRSRGERSRKFRALWRGMCSGPKAQFCPFRAFVFEMNRFLGRCPRLSHCATLRQSANNLTGPTGRQVRILIASPASSAEFLSEKQHYQRLLSRVVIRKLDFSAPFHTIMLCPRSAPPFGSSTRSAPHTRDLLSVSLIESKIFPGL